MCAALPKCLNRLPELLTVRVLVGAVDNPVFQRDHLKRVKTVHPFSIHPSIINLCEP